MGTPSVPICHIGYCREVLVQNIFSFSHRLSLEHAIHYTVAELDFSSKRTSLILMELHQIFISKVIITLEKAHNTQVSFTCLLFRIDTESPFMFEAPCVLLLPFQYSTCVHRNNNSNFEMQLSKERQRRKICTSSSFDLQKLT